ncbi:MAG: HAMP domain-containing sensor histidine kinase, partial [Chthoniobacteraceae bacterium]
SFPLPAKILACFFLNLVLIAVAGVYMAQGQFRFGLDSLLTGSSGERVQTMASLIVSELNGRKRSEWTAILQRFADAYHVQLAAVQNDGTRLAGTIGDPPPAVLKKLTEGNADRGRPLQQDPRRPRDRPDGEFRPGFLLDGQPRNPPPRDGQPRDGQAGDPRRGFPLRPGPNGERPPFREDEPNPPDDGRPPREGPPAPLPGGGPNGFPKFIVRAGEPPMYWIGVRTPLPNEGGRPGQPSSLLIVVPSLASGGLLLDVTPWLWVGAGLLACSVLLWLPLVRGITRSVRQMTGAAGQMAQGQFGTRVDTDRRDELGRLGESLNHMSGRLGEYVTGQKRFLGDIAHELCSPLARMEMALGVLEQQASEKQQGYVTDVREEVRHMSSLVNELLSFSKAGLRAKDLELRAVPLAELCGIVITREAQGKSDITVNVDAALSVLADPDLLARAIGNVLRNAIRYAGATGPIVLSANTRGASVTFAITDSGAGVAPETLHRLFDPFYRPETARTREGGGAGLGLAIVKSCVEACGGSVAVKNAQPRGLEVTMNLRRAI